MKITLNKTVEVSKDLPQHFKVGTLYFKISDHENYYTRLSLASDLSFNIFPELSVQTVTHLNIWIQNKEIEPISAEDFRLAFLQTCSDIEKIAL